MSRTAAVKQHVELMLTMKLDDVLKVHKFIRRKRSTTYTREIAEGKQTIDLSYDVSPRYAKEADAHLLPRLRLWLTKVNEVAFQMAGGEEQLIAADGATLFEPIEMVAPKSETPRWLPAGEEDFLEAGEDVRAFIERWVVPFLDEYQSARALVNGYEKGDWRPMLQQHSYIYIAAAYIVLDAREKAREVIETKLGAPGLRKRFAPVFEYFEHEPMPS